MLSWRSFLCIKRAATKIRCGSMKAWQERGSNPCARGMSPLLYQLSYPAGLFSSCKELDFLVNGLFDDFFIQWLRLINLMVYR